MPIIEGKRYSYAELSRKSGIAVQTLWYRYKGNPDITLDELIKKPVNSREKKIIKDKNGKEYTIRSAAYELGMRYDDVRYLYNEHGIKTLEEIQGKKKKKKTSSLSIWGKPDWNKLTYAEVKEAGKYSKDMEKQQHLNITCDLLGIDRKYAKDLVNRFGDF